MAIYNSRTVGSTLQTLTSVALASDQAYSVSHAVPLCGAGFESNEKGVPCDSPATAAPVAQVTWQVSVAACKV